MQGVTKPTASTPSTVKDGGLRTMEESSPITVEDAPMGESVATDLDEALRDALNAPAPAHRLPGELLAKIIILSVKDDDIHFVSQLIKVTHVCQRWRAVTTTTPHPPPPDVVEYDLLRQTCPRKTRHDPDVFASLPTHVPGASSRSAVHRRRFAVPGHCGQTSSSWPVHPERNRSLERASNPPPLLGHYAQCRAFATEADA